MKLRVLGSGSGMPDAKLNCSAVLVHSDEHCFLLDCGEGVSKSLLQLNQDPESPDAVIITHFHPDHVGGLFLYIQMLYLAGRKKPLPLFLPERERDFGKILQMFYTFTEKFSFSLSLLPMHQLTQHFPNLHFIQNDHLEGYADIISKNYLSNEQKAFSIRINSTRGDFVYSSDIGTTDSIRDLLPGAHTLLVDAGHPKAEQILKLKDIGVKRVLLTHRPGSEVLCYLQEHPGSVFELAEEGKEYII